MRRFELIKLKKGSHTPNLKAIHMYKKKKSFNYDGVCEQVSRIVLTIFLKGSHSVTKGPTSHSVPTTVGVPLAQWNYFIHTVLKFNFWDVGGGWPKIGQGCFRLNAEYHFFLINQI